MGMGEALFLITGESAPATLYAYESVSSSFDRGALVDKREFIFEVISF